MWSIIHEEINLKGIYKKKMASNILSTLGTYIFTVWLFSWQLYYIAGIKYEPIGRRIYKIHHILFAIRFEKYMNKNIGLNSTNWAKTPEPFLHHWGYIYEKGSVEKS